MIRIDFSGAPIEDISRSRQVEAAFDGFMREGYVILDNIVPQDTVRLLHEVFLTRLMWDFGTYRSGMANQSEQIRPMVYVHLHAPPVSGPLRFPEEEPAAVGLGAGLSRQRARENPQVVRPRASSGLMRASANQIGSPRSNGTSAAMATPGEISMSIAHVGDAA
jgi:hypothetical protein